MAAPGNRAARVRKRRESRVAPAVAAGVFALLAALAILLVHAPFTGAATTPTTPASAATTASTAPASTAAQTTAAQPATPSTTQPTGARRSEGEVLKIFEANGKVASWLRRYPANPATSTSYSGGVWTVIISSGTAGQIATGKVDDGSGAIIEAWTGPQVAWTMARGLPGAFGGKRINTTWVWLALAGIFLLGLFNWRRPFSLRNLDLLVLLSFSLPLWFFNHGRVFASMATVYPGLAWLIARCAWKGWRNTASAGSVVWPAWVLIVATLCLIGFRIDTTLNHSNVIDVGYSGVIGAERIAHFQSPYGHFPNDTPDLPKCGPPDGSGYVRDHIQTNGRCESAAYLGDTYGPVTYEAYLPGYLAFGWTGRWDSLPSAHWTTVLWDLICILGLWFVGRRFGGARLGAILTFAWAAWPFTQYAASNNTNDLIMPALLVWGFFFATSPVGRGMFAALSGWTKFASLIVAPLWSGYPDAKLWRPRLRFVAGFALATALAFIPLLFERSPAHAAVVFYHRTFSYQLGRDSPFSLWDWGQYHARGLPDLQLVQTGLRVLLVVAALGLARWPRYRSPLQLAALTGALLVGFEFTLTHWSFLYLAWFFPFVAFALLAPSRTEQLVGVAAPPVPDEASGVPEEADDLSERGQQIAVLATAIVVFLSSWAIVSGHWFYANPTIIDTPLYLQYSAEIRGGEVPYRDFAIEYPPGALPAFVAPSFLGGDYGDRFGALMAICGVACLVFVALSRPPPWAIPFLAISPLLIGSMAPTRYDFWPIAFVSAGLAALLRDRHRLGWAALAVAFAIKLFAVVLIPPAVFWTLRRRGRRELAWGLGIWTAIVAAWFVPFAVLSPHGLYESVWGQLSRPLEVGALGSSILKTFGHPAIIGSHGSLNIAGHGAVGAASSLVALVALVALWIGFARGPADSDRLVRYSAACVCALLAFGKVLSPQFLIWLVPLVPLVRGRRGMAATAILAAILINTLTWFPFHFYSYAFNSDLAWLVLVRNLLLVALFCVLSVPSGVLEWARERWSVNLSRDRSIQVP